MILFDLETDGFVEKCTRVHCAVLKCMDTGERKSYGPGQEYLWLPILDGRPIGGHNVLGFDLPVLDKLYGFKPTGQVRDTLVMSRLMYADLRDRDFTLITRDEEFPRKYIGSHSLAAWGYRLANHKTEYTGGFESFNDDMLAYCEQDVEVTATLWDKLLSKGFSNECVELEHEVFRIIQEQEKHGFKFDVRGASDLLGDLVARRDELHGELHRMFPPWEVRTPFTPKRDNKTRGYVAGVTIDKVKTVEFNPNSRDHIAQKLKEKYQWAPKEFTPEGKPKVDETTLETLPYPEAKLLAEAFLVQKRLGMLAEGRNSWLKLEKDGRLHGRVNTNGAVTGRMTHSHPNMAQVPSTRALYGKECRQLFVASPGYSLVGCDADALELRCLAHFMAYFGGEDYVDVVLNGDKSDGSDIHSRNARIIGCSRDDAKTFFYAFIYGAGVRKLGSILGKGPAYGKAKRQALMRGVPALGRLDDDVKARVESRGYLKGIDGRKLHIRSSHAALNTLLQSAGAVIMKQALVNLEPTIILHNAKFVANVHDEFVIETPKGKEDEVGKAAVEAIRHTTEQFNFRCPLDAQFQVGQSWADIH